MEFPIAKRQHVAAKLKCPHDRCCIFVTANEVQDHVMECPHGPCACIDPDCDFATSPIDLIGHLFFTHSIYVNCFPYDKDFLLVQLTVPETGQPRRQIIGVGSDSSVFALYFNPRDTYIGVSVMCVRSVPCICPRYRIKLWADDPAMPGLPNLDGENLLDKVETVFVPMSSPTPGTVSLEEVTSFLFVPPQFLSVCEPSKELSIWFRIDPQDSTSEEE